MAIAMRVVLLWDDPFPHGYDGYYYVLQVNSGLDGQPFFADRSLVFPVLRGLTRLLGDVVLANKVAACVFAAITSVFGAIAAWRWTERTMSGVVCGLWWALSSLHLAVSAEFLKNAAGLGLLAALIAVLPGSEHRRGQQVALIALAAVGLATHKLTGAFGVLLVLGYAVMTLSTGRRIPWRTALIGGGVLGIAGAVGVLRVVDLSRFIEGLARTGDRMAPWTDGRLALGEQVALALALVGPLVLAVVAYRRPERRLLAAPLAALAVLCLAPGLPFGYDLTAWRLMLLGFIGTGLAAAVLAERRPIPVLALTVGLALLLPSTLSRATRREPDYAAWYAILPRLVVPEGDRFIAQRGVCGFLWAETGTVCENFEPTGDPAGWWRVVYGFGPAQLSSYGDTVPLVPGYSLMREADWRAFRDGHDYPLLTSPRNPHTARPDFVYGPEDAD